MSEQRRLLILGTRTFAVEVADLASDVPDIIVDGFVENMDRDKVGTHLEQLPIHWIDDVATLADTHQAVCALSTTHRDDSSNRPPPGPAVHHARPPHGPSLADSGHRRGRRSSARE